VAATFSITYVPDWRQVPGAIWVHTPDPVLSGAFVPAAPAQVPHKGYPVLRIPFEEHELLFCSAAHLDHYIDVLSRPRLPTSRQLSIASGLATGPNQHWLSRLPAALKSPRKRPSVVTVLMQAREFILANPLSAVFHR